MDGCDKALAKYGEQADQIRQGLRAARGKLWFEQALTRRETRATSRRSMSRTRRRAAHIAEELADERRARREAGAPQ